MIEMKERRQISKRLRLFANLGIKLILFLFELFVIHERLDKGLSRVIDVDERGQEREKSKKSL